MALKILLSIFAILAFNNSVYLLPIDDYIKPNTPENIYKLQNLGPNDLPELYSGQYQGDMVLLPHQWKALDSNNSMGRNGITPLSKKWTCNIVPYLIPKGVFSTAESSNIKKAMNLISGSTKVIFEIYDKKKHKKNYVLFTSNKNGGCYSFVGMVGGAQKLNLGTGCFNPYIIAHELIHALGYYHMQSSAGRDKFVKIIFENIINGKKHNFYEEKGTSLFGTSYDYGSVMHYPADAFSKNKKPTIKALKKLNGLKMGQRSSISAGDFKRINMRYTKDIPKSCFPSSAPSSSKPTSSEYTSSYEESSYSSRSSEEVSMTPNLPSGV